MTKSEQATDVTSRVSAMYAIILRGNGVGSVDAARLLKEFSDGDFERNARRGPARKRSESRIHFAKMDLP